MLWSVLLALHLGPVSPTVPNRQPQLAANQALVAMTFASAEGIWLAKSTDGGRSWGGPSKVADLPKLLAGRHRGPRVVISGDALLVSAIPTGSDLFCWRSTDGGRTWSKPVVINDKPTSAREGLHAMAADGEGHVASAWLDDRMPGGKRLWGAFSEDGGKTWGRNVLLYESASGTICQCCHPSLLSLGHGEFAVMWRNVMDGSRDFYVMRLKGGKAAGPAVKQGQGTWKLDACPMDGGGMVLDGSDIVTAWRREHNVFLARPGRPETDLGMGQDVALAEGRKGPVAVWVSGKTVRLFEAGKVSPQALSENGAFPNVVALPDGTVLAAWEEAGGIATKRIE